MIIVITSGDILFTASSDLDYFRERTTDDNPEPSVGMALIESLIDCDIPVIDAVEGMATGISTTILLHCDSVFSGNSTRVRTAFIDIGLVAVAASTVMMPLHIGSRMTAELLLFGKTLDAIAAVDCGLVSRVVSDAETLNADLCLASRVRR